MFERLQFEEASEKVVLLIARGSGGCNAFSLLPVEDASDLASLRLFGPSHYNVAPANEGKWSDLFLTVEQRQLFKRAVDDHCRPLSFYGSTELGTVTGANSFFALSESTRLEFGLSTSQLRRISPPGSKHLKGLSFSKHDWTQLRDADEAVWLLHPSRTDRSGALRAYLAHGEELGIPDGYKCRIRKPWWRPQVVAPPDLFFTYMSHRYPRLVRNSARVSFLNSMHGVRLRNSAPEAAASALPLLCLNSITMLGAEIFGRSYGGGILKMEPREAASLPVPDARALTAAFDVLSPERDRLDKDLRQGRWTGVVERVDEVLLQRIFGLTAEETQSIRNAVIEQRKRRIGKPAGNG
jgi:adenine-specific DNA-methyltransferase